MKYETNDDKVFGENITLCWYDTNSKEYEYSYEYVPVLYN